MKFLTEAATLDCGFTDQKLNVLAHAQAIELEIGSRCGGHGICGGDRVLVSAEMAHLLSPVTDIEREHLSAGKIARGWRLACQCFPQASGSEIVVEVPA